MTSVLIATFIEYPCKLIIEKKFLEDVPLFMYT
jgi:hypothetical protein